MIQPVGDNILIRIDQQEEQEIGGIVIPQTSLGRKFASKVIAIGDEVTTVKVGDTILTDKYTGIEVEVDDEPHMFVKESELLAVV